MVGLCAGSISQTVLKVHPCIEPDPGIVGIGVLVSFVISAGITLLASLTGVILDVLPQKIDVQRKPSVQNAPATASVRNARSSSTGSAEAPPDVMSTDPIKPSMNTKLRLHRRLEISDERREYWATIIERFVLGLADQQLIIGTAILLVGFIECEITVYHFTIVNDLAWLSSNTRLTAMSIISDYLREYPAARLWRVSVMILMAILLFISTIFLFHNDWHDSLAQPAYCLFQSIQGNIIASDSAFWMAYIDALLLYGYASATIPLFPGVYAPIRGFGKK